MDNKTYSSNNSTISLLKLIGSPFLITKNEDYEDERICELYDAAIKNRMPLFFLDTLHKNKKLNIFKDVYKNQLKRYYAIFDVMAEVSEFMNNKGIEHAIFKSLKPFPDASVDIDTIIFSTEYKQLLHYFSSSKWKLFGYGPQSATFNDDSVDVGIDLYRDIAVSWFIYLNKNTLLESLETRTLPNEKKVQTLSLEADLIATIAHSVIKEQLFTIAEFYTFMRWLDGMNANQIDIMIELTQRNRIVQPVKAFVTIASSLHEKAFGFIPRKALLIMKKLGYCTLETEHLKKRGFETPHKYHRFTVGLSIVNKLREKNARDSFALQGYRMINPNFAKEFMVDFFEHLSRQTY